MLANQDKADVILHGGQVLTVTRNEDVEQAISIKGELIQATASLLSAEVERLANYREG